MLPWEAASYSPALYCSTIGADGLNFSVRNGKRWIPDPRCNNHLISIYYIL